MSLTPKWILPRSGAYRRFQQNYDTAWQALEAKKKAPAPPAWIAEAEALLAKAAARLKEGDLDGAWHSLRAADHLAIPHLDEQELWNREQMLSCEAENIKSEWRQSAIKKLLGGPPEKPADEGRALRLRDAAVVLTDYYETQYYKTWMLRDHLRRLLLISVAALVVFLALVGLAGTPITQWPEWDWKTLLAVLLFGVLGACLSATRKVSGETAASKNPERATEDAVTFSRTILGGIPALAVYAMLRAKLIQTANLEMPQMLVFAFAAGFSERLVLKVLESVDAGQEKKP
ncbi:MAG: hypothetical protein FJW34_19300 [Acidobacteria bacterium]|nr:hypothetical protein [Acidobacteriota bacterium]